MDQAREALIDWGSTADEPKAKTGRPRGPAKTVTCLKRAGKTAPEAACGVCSRCQARKRQQNVRSGRNRKC